MTDEPAVQRQLMRMHGFGLMNMVLTQLSQDRQVVLLVRGQRPRCHDLITGTRVYGQMEAANT